MKTIKVSFPENDLRLLDLEAKQEGLHRAELIRKRINQSRAVGGKTLQPSDYNEVVAKARKRMGSTMSREQVEACVAFTFRCLAEL